MKTIHDNMILLGIDLRLFDAMPNTNVTTADGMTVEMKTFYSDYLIDLAEAELIHDQFGQKHPIPQHGGKTIEFRQFDPLPELTTPLKEGVTPDGQALSVKAIEATVDQYGGYVTYADMLLMTAIDNHMTQGTKLIGSQAGRTSDTITRDIINAGTVVQYADGTVTSRDKLVGGASSGNHYMTVDDIKKAVRFLEGQDAPKINGYYVAIIHPDVKYDLIKDPEWQKPHEYVDTDHIYKNEIGELYGVRFVQSSRAKIFKGADLTAGARNLTVKSVSGKTVTVDEVITAADASAMAGREVIIKGVHYTVASAAAAAAGSATITVKETVSGSPTAGEKVYPGEGGANGRAVYSTIILADDAYGVTEVTGGGLELIVKQLGSAGTADPINQRATIGWKLTKTAEILVPQYIVRLETTASA